MTAPIDIEAQLAALRADVDALKAAAAAVAQQQRQAREWLRSLRRDTTTTDPKPREATRD